MQLGDRQDAHPLRGTTREYLYYLVHRVTWPTQFCSMPGCVCLRCTRHEPPPPQGTIRGDISGLGAPAPAANTSSHYPPNLCRKMRESPERYTATEPAWGRFKPMSTAPGGHHRPPSEILPQTRRAHLRPPHPRRLPLKSLKTHQGQFPRAQLNFSHNPCIHLHNTRMTWRRCKNSLQRSKPGLSALVQQQLMRRRRGPRQNAKPGRLQRRQPPRQDYPEPHLPGQACISRGSISTT